MTVKKHTWRFYVIDWDGETVWLNAKDADNFEGELEMDMPIKQYKRMFGKANLSKGRYGTFVIKFYPDGRERMRGWPYSRKWTQAQIDTAEREADALYEALHRKVPPLFDEE